MAAFAITESSPRVCCVISSVSDSHVYVVFLVCVWECCEASQRHPGWSIPSSADRQRVHAVHAINHTLPACHAYVIIDVITHLSPDCADLLSPLTNRQSVAASADTERRWYVIVPHQHRQSHSVEPGQSGRQFLVANQPLTLTSNFLSQTPACLLLFTETVRQAILFYLRPFFANRSVFCVFSICMCYIIVTRWGEPGGIEA